MGVYIKKQFSGGGGGGGGACPWTPLAFRDFHIFLVGALILDIEVDVRNDCPSVCPSILDMEVDVRNDCPSVCPSILDMDYVRD